jgi:catechol 2,3-dioxygenase-like lactoylglutathione lyase family enzyme
MRFGHLEVFVTDPARAQEFYTQVLGFDLVAVQGSDFVWVKIGEIELLLRRGRPAAPASAYQSASSALVLYTNDLDRTAEQLRQRGLRFAGTDGSDRSLTFTDPDGNWFQLANPDE